MGQQTNTGIQHCDARMSCCDGTVRPPIAGLLSFFLPHRPQTRGIFSPHGVGRSGLIDTAVKTAQIGYIQRRIIKTLEPVKIGYDYRVFKVGRFLQSRFGGNGLGCEKLRPVPISNGTRPPMRYCAATGTWRGAYSSCGRLSAQTVASTPRRTIARRACSASPSPPTTWSAPTRAGGMLAPAPATGGPWRPF